MVRLEEVSLRDINLRIIPMRMCGSIKGMGIRA